MRNTLTNFNKVLNTYLIQQEIEATLDGQAVPVKQDGKGNAQISLEIPINQQNQDGLQTVDYNLVIDQLKLQLTNLLSTQIQASRTAKHYAPYSPKQDLPKVMYNYGFAEGKKNILKYILNKLNKG